MAPSIGWSADEFFTAYEDNRHSGHVTAIEASAVAQAVVLLMEAVSVWRGTATEVLESLNQLVTEEKRKARNWPKSPRGMSGALKRIAPNLREMDITVEFFRSTGRDRTRQVEIKRGADASEPSASSETGSGQADANRTANENRPSFASEQFEPGPDGSDGTDAHKRQDSQSNLFDFEPSATYCDGCGEVTSLVAGLCPRCREGGSE